MIQRGEVWPPISRLSKGECRLGRGSILGDHCIRIYRESSYLFVSLMIPLQDLNMGPEVNDVLLLSHNRRSLEILKTSFTTDVLINQDPWREPEKYNRLLQLLPDRALTEALRGKWDSYPSRPSVKKWADINDIAKSGVSRNLNTTQLIESKQDIVFEYLYPRLDVEVSKHLNHLLKSPFVVHPGTGRLYILKNTPLFPLLSSQYAYTMKGRTADR